jgi:hypothetical protein
MTWKTAGQVIAIILGGVVGVGALAYGSDRLERPLGPAITLALIGALVLQLALPVGGKR